ncbi:DUF4381 family protein [Dyella ginsengisoli]|uniref:DUF4381 family protein n=1 Tax=Dyella ginsengisoli TaxID=363848 RepID=UPI00034D46D9|nr:DUF4381 family protein [Dyella ginsengisoli]
MSLPLPASAASAASAPSGPELRDIHLPPPPSWWPPAPGWWVLAALASLLLAWAVWRWISRQRHLRARAALLALVDDALSGTEGRPQEAAAALHALLRRAARRLDGGGGTLRGEAWREMLERVPVDAAVIDRLTDLDTLIYRPAQAIERDALADAVRAWLGAFADQTRRSGANRRARR